MVLGLIIWLICAPLAAVLIGYCALSEELGAGDIGARDTVPPG